jgi:hypothetical protein
VNSGEYKVMGLAPYGEPKYVKTIKDRLVEIRDDGSLWMNMEHFTFPQSLTMTGESFGMIFDGPARKPESNLTQREMDLARSIQDITEEVMMKMATFASKETGIEPLHGQRRRPQLRRRARCCETVRSTRSGFSRPQATWHGARRLAEPLAPPRQAAHEPRTSGTRQPASKAVARLQWPSLTA